MTRFTAWIVTGLLLTAACLLAIRTAFAADPMVAGPDIYKLQFENDRVRIMEVTFPSGAQIAEHSHPDHIVVVTQAGKLRLHHPGGTSMEINGNVGDAVFIPAETHSAVNVGMTEFKAIVIELKENAAVPDTTDSAMAK